MQGRGGRCRVEPRLQAVRPRALSLQSALGVQLLLQSYVARALGRQRRALGGQLRARRVEILARRRQLRTAVGDGARQARRQAGELFLDALQAVRFGGGGA
jgi:hypothetical protein